MKTIGLIGGMSWESTRTYYELINREVKARLGGLHSAKCVLVSVDFAEIEALQRAGDWAAAGDVLADAARALARAGAQCIVICTNTMHLVADAVRAAVDVPLLHIAELTGQAVVAAGVRRVALLGTRFTMEQDFYKGRLREAFGLDVLTPDEADRTLVHDIIYRELVLGDIRPASREAYLRIIGGLAARGAEAVIFGCTEIGLLVNPADSPIPAFDTTVLHATGAVAWALATEKAGTHA